MYVNSFPRKVPTPPKSDMESLISMMKDVVLRFDKLEAASGPT